MKWKDAPHLFANGRFKICNGFGYMSHLTPNELANLQSRWKREGWLGIESYNLVARKIEDITDEELTQFIWGDLFYEQCLPPRKAIEIDSEHETGVFLALLSLGVYPFDQSHFGETVIDINEVEK